MSRDPLDEHTIPIVGSVGAWYRGTLDQPL